MGLAALKRLDVRLAKAATAVQKQGVWSALLSGGGSEGDILAHASSAPGLSTGAAEEYETVSVHSEPGVWGGCAT